MDVNNRITRILADARFQHVALHIVGGPDFYSESEWRQLVEEVFKANDRVRGLDINDIPEPICNCGSVSDEEGHLATCPRVF